MTLAQQLVISACIMLLVLAAGWIARIGLRAIRECERLTEECAQLRSERDLLNLQVGTFQNILDAVDNARRMLS